MRVVFTRHGAPMSLGSDPSLSDAGVEMVADLSTWLVDNGIVADHCLLTGTRRTRETADELLRPMPHVRKQVVPSLPETPEAWEQLVRYWEPRIGSHGVLFLVGHHPTVELLLSLHGPPAAPVQRGAYAVCLVLDRIFTGSWVITGAWPGRFDTP